MGRIMASRSSNSRQNIPGDRFSQRFAMVETEKDMQAVAMHHTTHAPPRGKQRSKP